MLAVNGSGTLIGVVPAQVLVHVLRREHVEDLHLLAGIRREPRRGTPSRIRRRGALATAAMAGSSSTRSVRAGPPSTAMTVARSYLENVEGGWAHPWAGV